MAGQSVSAPFSIALQAGGASRRMGRDKGLLPFRGLPLIEFIRRQVEGLSDDLFIISNRPQEYAAFGLPVYPDVLPGKGALGGLYTALHHAQCGRCFVLACDMPFVNREMLRWMAALAGEWEAVVPRGARPGWVEPFRGVYAAALKEGLRAALEGGVLRIGEFLSRRRVRYLSPEEIRRFDPRFRTFINLNTPEDLAALQAFRDERRGQTEA